MCARLAQAALCALLALAALVRAFGPVGTRQDSGGGDRRQLTNVPSTKKKGRRLPRVAAVEALVLVWDAGPARVERDNKDGTFDIAFDYGGEHAKQRRPKMAIKKDFGSSNASLMCRAFQFEPVMSASVNLCQLRRRSTR